MLSDLVPFSGPNFRVTEPLQKWLDEVSPSSKGASFHGGNIEGIDSAEKLWVFFDRNYEVEFKGRIACGLALLRIRELSNRDFAAGLKARGFSAGTAYRLMQAATLYLSLPSLEAIHRACELDFAALTQLGQFLGDEGFAMLVDGKRVSGITFDEARTLSKRDIEELRKVATLKDDAIRKLKKQLDDSSHRADMAESDARLARGEAADLPPWARAVRTEAACASETVLAAIDIARAAFFKALETPLETGANKASRARHLQDAGFLMHVTIQACAAKAAAFAEEIAGHIGDVDQVGAAPILTKAEIKDFEKRRNEILETARADYDERERDRANGQRDGFKKRRGAPRGPRKAAKR